MVGAPDLVSAKKNFYFTNPLMRRTVKLLKPGGFADEALLSHETLGRAAWRSVQLLTSSRWRIVILLVLKVPWYRKNKKVRDILMNVWLKVVPKYVS